MGFLIGAINTYFFTHKSWFSPDEYGLTRILVDVSVLVAAISTLGTTTFLYKFFPYYKSNLDNKKNDILSIALLVSAVGFIFTCLQLWVFQPLVVQKLGTNSQLFIQYFYYVIPLGGCLLLYTVLEAYSYGFDKGVFTSFLKELVVRLYTFVAILLKVFNVIDFDDFVLLFAFQYFLIIVILAVHLHLKGELFLSLKVSRVTRKFRKKILAIMAFTFMVVIVTVLRQTIDSLVLAAREDLAKVGIFGFSVYLVSLMQAPFRSIVAVTIPILSRSWKEKNIKEITKIYQRSSINLLSFALCIFYLVWLNFDDAILFFGINPEYLDGKWVFFILGIVSVIEMGTGVSGQIIGTSNYWRFELWTSLLLTALIIPLSYFLTVQYGIIGPAAANLIAFTIYNGIRMFFLYKKFHMQPFSKKTLEIAVFSLIAYLIVFFVTLDLTGLLALVARSGLFLILLATVIYYRNISPDVKPIILAIRNRFAKRK